MNKRKACFCFKNSWIQYVWNPSCWSRVKFSARRRRAALRLSRRSSCGSSARIQRAAVGSEDRSVWWHHQHRTKPDTLVWLRLCCLSVCRSFSLLTRVSGIWLRLCCLQGRSLMFVGLTPPEPQLHWDETQAFNLHRLVEGKSLS